MKKIIVPLDKDAEYALDFNFADKEQLIEVHFTDDEFYPLFNSKFFSKINELTNSNIDDFEDEKINTQENLKIVLGNDYLFSNNHSEQINKSVYVIHELFKEALTRNTGIYFYF